MRNYMKEYREALDERSLFECGSEKWNAVDEKLDCILRDGTVAHDDRKAWQPARLSTLTARSICRTRCTR